MSAGLIAQYAVIGIAVAVSGIFVWKTRFPGSFRRARIALAAPLVREGRPAWMQRIGRWIAPLAISADNSCAGCHGCD